MSSSESEVEEQLSDQQSDGETEKIVGQNGETAANVDDKPVSWSDLVCTDKNNPFFNGISEKFKYFTNKISTFT